MENPELFFSKVEKYKAPSTILFRSVELKLLKERLGDLFRSKSILDLGCGDGIAASVIFDRQINFGLDNNPLAVECAKKSNAYQKVILADAAGIPLKEGSVDVVFSNCSLEHIKDLNSVLKEVFRILVKNGLFIFTTPSEWFQKYNVFARFGLSRLSKIYGKLRDKKLNHYHCHSLENWSSILNQSSFKLVDGCYYIDKGTAEFWDLLFILNPLFRLLLVIHPKLLDWVYNLLLRKRIYRRYAEAKILKSDGAAVCVAAQKT